MANSRRISSLIEFLIPLFPYILLATAIFGVLAAIAVNSLELTIGPLSLAAPICLAASLLVILKRRDILSFYDVNLDRYSSKLLILPFFIIFIISCLILVENETRPPTFFFLFSLASGVVVYQIMRCRSKLKHIVVLFEIVLLSLILIWGLNLRYPLYYGWTDILAHLHFIDVIIMTGSTHSLELTYQSFPLFHIAIATCNEILDLPLTDCYFFCMGLVWQVGILFSYLLFKRLSLSSDAALISCLLFAFGSQVIFYGAYSVTRSLAFVFFLILIYILHRGQTSIGIRITFMMMITAIALMLTHHHTALFTISLLTIMLILKRITVGESEQGPFNVKFMAALLLSFLLYLLLFAFDFTSDTITFFLRRLSYVGASGGGFVSIQNGYLLTPEIILNSIVLGISLFGIGNMLGFGRKKPSRYEVYIASICLVFLFLYLPSIISLIPFSDTLLLYRLRLLVSPFIALAMAQGLMGIYGATLLWRNSRFKMPAASILLVSIVIATTFIATISEGNAIDSPFMANGHNDSGYFSTSDIASFMFFSTNSEYAESLFSDYSTIRDTYHLNSQISKEIIRSGNIDYIDEGYVLLRISQLESDHCLLFRDFGSTKNYCYSIDNSDNQSNIMSNLYGHHLIYNDGGVRIHYTS